MNHSLDLDRYMTVPDAYSYVTGYRPHPSSCWRYTTKGMRGKILKYYLINGRRMTTPRDILAFIAAPSTNENNNGSTTREQLLRELGNDTKSRGSQM